MFKLALVLTLSLVISSWTMALAQEATPTSDTHNQATIFSNGLDLLPAGEPGEVSVIAVGTFPQPTISIPVIVHNNSDNIVYNIDLKAEITDTEGKLVGIETESYGTYPVALNPGEIALTAIQPDPDKLPAEVEFSFTVSFETEENLNQYSRVLEFGDVALTENRLLGEVMNPHDTEVSDIWLFATCLNSEGVPYNFEVTSAATNGTDDVVLADESTTFQVDIFGEPCESFLLTGYAH